MDERQQIAPHQPAVCAGAAVIGFDNQRRAVWQRTAGLHPGQRCGLHVEQPGDVVRPVHHCILHKCTRVSSREIHAAPVCAAVVGRCRRLLRNACGTRCRRLRRPLLAGAIGERATAGWAADRCAAYAANQQDCCKAKHEQRLRTAHKRGKFKIHGRRLACNAGACAHITKDHTQLTQLALEKRSA